MSELSEDEIKALKKLVPLADEIAKDAEYQKSRNVVVQRWRTLIIGLAAFIVAVALLWEKFRAIGTWLLR